jgi:hypothetical protein
MMSAPSAPAITWWRSTLTSSRPPRSCRGRERLVAAEQELAQAVEALEALGAAEERAGAEWRGGASTVVVRHTPHVSRQTENVLKK